jgi:hypothetical protein
VDFLGGRNKSLLSTKKNQSNMYSRFYFIIILFIFTAACGEKGKRDGLNLKSQNDTIGHSDHISPVKKDIPNVGLLKEVEDSGYPFVTITIEFPELKFTEYFTLNLEEVKNVSLSNIGLLVGKYVKYTHTSEKSYALLDVFKDSRSIFGSEFPVEGDDIKSIEGILKGAKQETSGDIPGEVSITAANGQNLFFQYFITPELVAVNGKKVTGFYDERTLNTITSIQLIED